MTIKRLKTSAGVLAGLSALALGGPAMAAAATTQTNAKAAPVERVPGRDGDHIQKGSQVTPDRASDRDKGKKAERFRRDKKADR